jgi:hypothetical protein
MELPEAIREQAIDDFMEGQPRADQWREMRQALADRLKDALASREEAVATGSPTLKFDRKIRELRDQVNALAEEEAISQFVEDSVRQSLQRPARLPVGDEDYEAED